MDYPLAYFSWELPSTGVWRTIAMRHRDNRDDLVVINEAVRGNPYHVKAADYRDKTVVDIGAHIGTFSCMAIEAECSTLVAIEPNAEQYGLTQRNIETAVSHRGQRPVVVLVHAAVGDPNVTPILAQPIADSSNMAVPADDGVECLNLSAVLRLAGGKIDILKVDCEGAEYAFFNAATTEEMRLVDTIHMEFHPSPGSMADLFTKLADTHAVSMFGPAATGGMMYAHRY